MDNKELAAELVKIAGKLIAAGEEGAPLTARYCAEALADNLSISHNAQIVVGGGARVSLQDQAGTRYIATITLKKV